MNRRGSFEVDIPRAAAGRPVAISEPGETEAAPPAGATDRVSEHALIWRSEWCTGIPTLDNDHRRLVELVNRLLGYGLPTDHAGASAEALPDHDASESPGAASLVQFDALVEHLRTHFKREEALMRSIDYEDLQTHSCEHSLQLAELAELRRQLIGEGRSAFSRESLQWIKRWCFDHFIAEDQRLSQAYVDRYRAGRAP